MIFNKYGTGADELKDLLGFIDANTNFNKWKTWISLSVRQITSVVGNEVYKLAEDHYLSDKYTKSDPGAPGQTPPEPEEAPEQPENQIADKILNELVRKIQLPNALFAYVKLLPSLDANHSNSGRKKTVGETERSLTAIEAYKDETNIMNLAYESLEDLLSFLESNQIAAWVNSSIRKSTRELLIQTAEDFNLYFKIDSARLYYTLLPMIREVQETLIVPAVTQQRVDAIIGVIGKTNPSDDDKKLLSLLRMYICRPMALATISLALQRLPVDLLPDGIVQTQITGSIKEKVVASDKAVQTMVSNLDTAVKNKMSALQEQISILDGANIQERYVTPPSASDNIKGFSFN